MKLDQALINDLEKSCGGILFDNFKKVVDELNFEDGMSGHYINGKNSNGCLWMVVTFDNSWELIVWEDGDYSMRDPNMVYGANNSVSQINYKGLLKYMEKQGVRKNRECEYKDADLYILDFER